MKAKRQPVPELPDLDEGRQAPAMQDISPLLHLQGECSSENASSPPPCSLQLQAVGLFPEPADKSATALSVDFQDIATSERGVFPIELIK